MAERPGTSWWLTPEQLGAACWWAGIDGLPESRHVREGEPPAGLTRSAGTRSLLAGRLAAERAGTIELEPALEAALLALTGDAHDAFAGLSCSDGSATVAFFAGGSGTALTEHEHAAELHRGPAAGLLARLTRRGTADPVAAGARIAARDDGAASVSLRRWSALSDGTAGLRRSDPALLHRAVTAVTAAGALELRWLVRRGELVVEGEGAAYVADAGGLIVLEDDPQAETEPAVLLRPATAGDLVALRDPWRELAAALEPRPGARL